MRKPKVEPINLPYASSVASYFGDQGAGMGSSFLGKFFTSAARSTKPQTFAEQAAPAKANTTSLFSKPR